MQNKIKSFEEVCKITKDLQKKNKKVVFVHGIFDILHKGHVYLLIEAKKLGDILVVGVDHDENARILKATNRPVNDHDTRMFILSNLIPVNFIFLIDSFKNENTSKFYQNIYKKLKPDFVATSLRAGKYGVYKKEQANLIKIKFVDISDYIHDKNTTKTLEILGLE